MNSKIKIFFEFKLANFLKGHEIHVFWITANLLIVYHEYYKTIVMVKSHESSEFTGDNSFQQIFLSFRYKIHGKLK